NLQVLAFEDRRGRLRMYALVAGAWRPVGLDAEAEAVLRTHLAVGQRLPQALRVGLVLDLEYLLLVFLFQSFFNPLDLAPPRRVGSASALNTSSTLRLYVTI